MIYFSENICTKRDSSQETVIIHQELFSIFLIFLDTIFELPFSW